MKYQLKESDVSDIIVSYLVKEGYANNEKNAVAIFCGMSEKWKKSIMEESRPFPIDKVSGKVENLHAKFKKSIEDGDFIGAGRIAGRVGAIRTAAWGGVRPAN